MVQRELAAVGGGDLPLRIAVGALAHALPSQAQQRLGSVVGKDNSPIERYHADGHVGGIGHGSVESQLALDRVAVVFKPHDVSGDRGLGVVGDVIAAEKILDPHGVSPVGRRGQA